MKYLFLIIPIVCLALTGALVAAYGHTQSYLHGYIQGINNVTMNTACSQYNGKAYDNCSSGFNNAQKTTPEYKYGMQAAKADSIIGVYDSTDVCAKYKGDANSGCTSGYSTGNDNKLLFTVDSITRQYKNSAQYHSGFTSGVVNGNESEACETFKGRNMSECQSAYNYGTNPTSYQPAHCSSNDNDANSCYSLGHDAGYSSSYKEIARCHMLTVPPSSGHVGGFANGFHDGWKFANAESFHNSTTTYFDSCTKQY